MKDNTENIIDELLIKYLTGLASEEERVEAKKWIELSEGNTQYFEKFKLIWESSSNLKAYQDIDTESSLKNVKKRIDFKQSKSKYRIPFTLNVAIRIAAIVLVFFSLYFIFRQNDEVNLTAKIITIESGNEIRTIILPDSSVVDLNKNSRIEYSDDFNKKERRLKFKGEAFFEVKPDILRPFIIETSRSETRVLGTAFNLQAYSGKETESIVVTHGLVEFKQKLDSSVQKVYLTKGEKAILSGKLVKEENSDLNFMAWKTGILIFDNLLLPDALKDLSDFYQVDFQIQDKRLETYTISGKYEKLGLPEMLEVLEMTLGVKSEKKNGQYLLNL